MKLVEKVGTIERSDEMPEGIFKIAATSKAFDILSSKLYSDVPKAIIRELSTNAYDAHVEVGKANLPFEVHLPNNFDSYFEIRDFGPGLSPDKVTDIYTVYFASTRSHSNEFTGALGLGSKSPFAYTDSFTVTSYFGGIARTYSLFKNERGVPSIALMGEVASTEPSGIRIKIPVKQYDGHTFGVAASQVYHYFKVKPIMKGQKVTPASPHKVSIAGPDYRIYEGGNGRTSVVMGQVCYNAKEINLRDFGFESYNTSVEIDLPMGSCSIAASREELQMDKATKDLISARLTAMMAEFQADMLDKSAACLTLLDGLNVQNEYRGRMPGLKRTITIHSKVDKKYHVTGMSMMRMRRSNKVRLSSDQFIDFTGASANYTHVFIENDLGVPELSSKARKRIIYYLSTNGTGRASLAVIQDRQEFEKTFGKPTLKLSTLPDPPADPSVPGGVMARNTSCIRSITQGHRAVWENVTKYSEDDEEAAIVLRENNIVKFGGMEQNIQKLQRMMAFTGITKVYGIPPRLYNKYDGDLEDIFDIAKRKIEDVVKKLTPAEKYNIVHNDRYGGHFLDDRMMKLIEEINDPDCKSFTEAYKIHEKMEDSIMIREMAGFFGIPLDSANLHDKVQAKYPLLWHVSVNSGSEKVILKELKVYIGSK
jgi:hypothetical protein